MPPQQIRREHAQMPAQRPREPRSLARGHELAGERVVALVEAGRHEAQAGVQRRDSARKGARREVGEFEAASHFGVGVHELDDGREAEPVGDGDDDVGPFEFEAAAGALGLERRRREAEPAL